MSFEQFQKDLTDEKYFGQILDNELYVPNNGFSNLQRYDDLNNQHSGIDLTVSFANNTWQCDEKNAISCGINLSTGEGYVLKTFAFEMFTTVNKYDHDGRIGLFLDKSKTTDSYMLLWPDKYRRDDRWIPVEYTYAFIPKQHIMEYLSSCGWTYDKLMAKKNQIVECWTNNGYKAYRENLVKRNGNIYFHDSVCTRKQSDKRCYFSPTTTSGQFHINVLIPRPALIGMSIASGTITHNET